MSGKEVGRLPVTAFTIDDGLPDDRVTRIVLDSHGFLWSCHRFGLARFDGQRFRAYWQEDGLPAGPVTDLLETPGGEYLVATREGIHRFQPRRGGRLFVPLAGTRTPPPPLRALARDRKGVLWAGVEPACTG